MASIQDTTDSARSLLEVDSRRPAGGWGGRGGGGEWVEGRGGGGGGGGGRHEIPLTDNFNQAAGTPHLGPNSPSIVPYPVPNLVPGTTCITWSSFNGECSLVIGTGGGGVGRGSLLPTIGFD